MSDKFNASQSSTIDRDNRNMAASASPGPMSQVLNDIWAVIDNSPVSISAAGSDIDSVAKGGGAFTIDTDTANGSTLTFAWKAGRFHNGLALVSVAAGTLTLSASNTNYVEVDRSGTVSSNTSGFTSGRLPLYKIVAGASTWDPVAGVTYSKPLMTLIGTGGVVGLMLSTAGATKELSCQFVNAITGTISFLIIAPNVAATLVAALLAESAAVAADNTNYWAFSLKNRGQTGVGATDMLSTAAVNSTQLTGGAAMVAKGPRSLTLHGTPGVDTNLNTAANDVLEITFTATGAPTALTEVTLRLDFSFTT